MREHGQSPSYEVRVADAVRAATHMKMLSSPCFQTISVPKHLTRAVFPAPAPPGRVAGRPGWAACGDIALQQSGMLAVWATSQTSTTGARGRATE